jgi:hypothetical protein
MSITVSKRNSFMSEVNKLIDQHGIDFIIGAALAKYPLSVVGDEKKFYFSLFHRCRVDGTDTVTLSITTNPEKSAVFRVYNDEFKKIINSLDFGKYTTHHSSTDTVELIFYTDHSQLPLDVVNFKEIFNDIVEKTYGDISIEDIMPNKKFSQLEKVPYHNEQLGSGVCFLRTRSVSVGHHRDAIIVDMVFTSQSDTEPVDNHISETSIEVQRFDGKRIKTIFDREQQNFSNRIVVDAMNCLAGVCNTQRADDKIISRRRLNSETYDSSECVSIIYNMYDPKVIAAFVEI